ncbi:MAG: Uma2 family endonuclease [Truepera sp.]|nr:Uma2 family endonuclease [Truepera sp.]
MTLVREQPEHRLRKFTYRDLVEMERAGILGEDERVELLHGNLITMTPVNPPHAWTVSELHKSFLQRFAEEAVVVSQNPLRLSENLDDDELPLPDVMLLRQRPYRDHPLPEDVYLLVEVSDSTLTKDRTVKLPLYAGVHIPEVWIVNLVDKQLEVYTEPRNRDYLARKTYALTATFAPARFPESAYQWLKASPE